MNEFFLNLSAFDIFAQCVGFCGTVSFFIGFQQKKRKKIILMQLFGILFFTAHFFLLGAYTGAMMNFLGLLRAFVYYNDNKKWAQNKAWFYGFMISYLVIGIITWENFFSLFPIIAMLLTTYGFTKIDPTLFRLFAISAPPLWFIYNIYQGSVSGVITECFTMTSLSIAIIRYDIIEKRKTKKSDISGEIKK